MNAIYFMGCRKLIREKQRMDWKDRNPNTIAKKRNKKNCKRARKEESFNSKNRNVNEVLKDSYDITEAEIKKKSEKKGSKRKPDERRYKKRKEEGNYEKATCGKRMNGDYDCVKQKNIGKNAKKPRNNDVNGDQKCVEKQKKRKRWNKIITSKSEAALKKEKRRRTSTEDIRVYFVTEDSH